MHKCHAKSGGDSEYLCINDRPGIQIAALDSRLRGNDGTPDPGADDVPRSVISILCHTRRVTSGLRDSDSEIVCDNR
jgi:hypothetical protein